MTTKPMQNKNVSKLNVNARKKRRQRRKPRRKKLLRNVRLNLIVVPNYNLNTTYLSMVLLLHLKIIVVHHKYMQIYVLNFHLMHCQENLHQHYLKLVKILVSSIFYYIYIYIHLLCVPMCMFILMQSSNF